MGIDLIVLSIFSSVVAINVQNVFYTDAEEVGMHISYMLIPMNNMEVHIFCGKIEILLAERSLVKEVSGAELPRVFDLIVKGFLPCTTLITVIVLLNIVCLL